MYLCHFVLFDVQVPDEDSAKFDTYTNDMWAVRHSALGLFQQAAWKIVLRNRAEKKLASLRDMVLNWGKQGFAVTDNSQWMAQILFIFFLNIQK